MIIAEQSVFNSDAEIQSLPFLSLSKLQSTPPSINSLEVNVLMSPIGEGAEVA